MENDHNNEGMVSTPYLEEESETLYAIPENEHFLSRQLYSPFLTSELFVEEDGEIGFEDGFSDGFWEENELEDTWEDKHDSEYDYRENGQDENDTEDEFWDYEAEPEAAYDYETETEDREEAGYFEPVFEDNEFFVEEPESEYEQEFYEDTMEKAKTIVDETFVANSIPDVQSEDLGEDDFEYEMGFDELEAVGEEYKIELENEDEEIAEMGNDGISPMAIQAEKQWDAAKDRPKRWIGQVYGLVVHTTGGSLPGKAVKCGIYPTLYAMNHYTGKKKNQCEYRYRPNRPGGCHYINGWQGIKGGDLLQIANEREKAWGVSTKLQRGSINSGKFEKDLPAPLVRHWKARWPTYKHSLALLPKSERYVNSCYIHVECPPVFYYVDGKSVTSKEYPPMRPGLRFTKAQHDSIAYLACDIAIRNGWPLDTEWWRTPRLLGHEDLTPISRKDRNGGWDPGYLRDKPYFDWDYVYDKISEIKNSGYRLPGQNAVNRGSGLLGDIIQKGKDTIGNIFQKGKLMSIALATISKGEKDENKITNAVFFAKYPSRQGQKLKRHDPLVNGWLNIRNNLVRPLLQKNKGGATTSIRENLTSIPDSLGMLRLDSSVPELAKSIPFYKFTKEDALWLARFVTGEAGVKNDANGHAVIWAMFNRFGILRHRVSSWSSFQKYLRLYSTTLQPMLRSKGAAQRVWRNYNKNPKKFPIVIGTGTYKGTNIRKVQYKRHIDLQKKKWIEIHPTVRYMVVNILRGKIPNPGIGIATEFAGTRIYYKQRYRTEPTREEWRRYTVEYAKNRCKKNFQGCSWIGQRDNLDQMKNAFFIDNRFKNVPPSAIKVTR